MKRQLLAGLAALFLAAAAQAGTLTSATWLQVTNGFPMSRSNAQLGASGTSTAGSIAVSLSYPATSIGFFMPNLIALESRLRRICRTRRGSVTMVSGSSGWLNDRLVPCSSANGLTVMNRSSIRLGTLTD